jgi:molecular chaperone DnaJ
MELTWFSLSRTGDDSHKNEGFLKSIWHNLTNHPAHHDNCKPADKPAADKPDSSKSSGSDTEKDKKKGEKEGSNKNDEPKKASGSGSNSG